MSTGSRCPFCGLRQPLQCLAPAKAVKAVNLVLVWSWSDLIWSRQPSSALVWFAPVNGSGAASLEAMNLVDDAVNDARGSFTVFHSLRQTPAPELEAAHLAVIFQV